MKKIILSLITCPKSGNLSSKRALSLLLGIATAVGIFVPYVSETEIIALATLILGNQGLTKDLNIIKKAKDEVL